MKSWLLFMLVVFAATAAVVGATAGAAGMGAPTENYTITDLPTSDSGHAAIVPAVNFVWQGPSTQTGSAPPSFIAAFSSDSTASKDRVTGNENWYLDIDINTPGWLYIYEYYPAGSDVQGKWIAYKWQLDQSGWWKLGPFTPTSNEAGGQHVYRIWFFSSGLWAAENPSYPQGNLVYWTYVKSTAEKPQPPQPPSTPAQASLPDQLYKFFVNPLVLLLGPSVIVVAVILGVRFARRRRREKQLQYVEPLSEEPALLPAIKEELGPVSSLAVTAKLVLSNGMEIKLAGDKGIGRRDFARMLGLDELVLISREHLQVTCADGYYHIEDSGSDNGTRLNGEEIKSKGPVILKDGDVIEPAGAVKMTFDILQTVKDV